MLIVWGALLAGALHADDGSSAGAPRWKATLSLYQLPDDHSYDANLRYKTDSYAAWVGAYRDSGSGDDQLRLGAEYDYQRGEALVVPSLQVATHGLVAASVYGELGGRWFAIVGASRTNLRPFFNLTFDPNESVQLGLGHAIGTHDRLTAYSIPDVRLHTGQQNTHVIWRHRAGGHRLTLDGLYKSGRIDDGSHVRAFGGTATYDFPRWFVRLAYDPYANFGLVDMWRFSGGWRF